MMNFYVLYQNFESALARVGEARTLDEARQIALAVYANPPSKQALQSLLGDDWSGADYKVAEPVISVYQRFPGTDKFAEQVFWIGLNETMDTDN